MRFIHFSLVIGAMLCAPVAAAAQNPDPNDKTEVYPLTLDQHAGIANGRIAMVEGEAGPDGVRLVVNKLSLLQPAAVALVADDKDADLRLALWKYAEDDVKTEASTRGDGIASFQFRTEDDLQLRIVSPGGPKRYKLAVWAGNEVELPMPSPFVPQSEFSGSSGTSMIMYVLTGGVLAIALLLGVMVFRNKKGVAVLFVLLAPALLDASPTPVSGTDWLVDAVKTAAGVGKNVAPGGTGKAFGWLEDAIGKGKSGADALKDYDTLTKGDKALDPNYRPAGSPSVPSHCAAPDGKGGEGCNDCFAAAHRKLTAVRVAFEKLRRVGTTTRSFAAKSIAFGDSVSGVHGVAGLGWQPERAKIEQSLKNFELAYDAKYIELAGLLEAALRDIGQCEAKHFNVPDWYDRYGFIYFTFMSDRYRGQ